MYHLSASIITLESSNTYVITERNESIYTWATLRFIGNVFRKQRQLIRNLNENVVQNAGAEKDQWINFIADTPRRACTPENIEVVTERVCENL